MKLACYFTCLVVLITGNMAIPQTTHLGQFGLMIRCLLGESLLGVLDYIGYGCYCGFGGDGIPLDATDMCCQMHDDCYTAVQTSDMCRGYYHAYYIPYQYNAFQCGTYQAQINCLGPAGYEEGFEYTDCAMAMCACDKAGAECFHRERPNFNEELIRYRQRNC